MKKLTLFMTILLATATVSTVNAIPQRDAQAELEFQNERLRKAEANLKIQNARLEEAKANLQFQKQRIRNANIQLIVFAEDDLRIARNGVSFVQENQRILEKTRMICVHSDGFPGASARPMNI